jgi:hypothetical protein
MSVVYVAGKMTGLPDEGREHFAAAAAMLRRHGHTVISPSELNYCMGSKRTYSQALRADLALIIAVVDAVYCLPNWNDSRGAKVERSVAEACGIVVWDDEGDVTEGDTSDAVASSVHIPRAV